MEFRACFKCQHVMPFNIDSRRKRVYRKTVVVAEKRWSAINTFCDRRFCVHAMTPCLLPPATKLGQGYVFTGVCDSVHRGGVPAQVPPQDQVPPRPGTPPGPGTPPQTRHTPRTRYTPRDQGDTVYARAVRILLECNLVAMVIFAKNNNMTSIL